MQHCHDARLKELSAHTGIDASCLEKKSYKEIKDMMRSMDIEKLLSDPEYIKMAGVYFTPMGLLKHWFLEDEVIKACAAERVSKTELCSEMYVEPGAYCPHPGGTYVRTAKVPVAQFDEQGRELAGRRMQKMDVYRTPSHFQNTRHGAVVMRLLYGRYPELERFGMWAGAVHPCSEYVLYTKIDIYVPFTALMSGNVDHILFYNRMMAEKGLMGHKLTKTECEDVLQSEEAQELFDTVVMIGHREEEAGRKDGRPRPFGTMPVHEDSRGNIVTDSGLVQTIKSGDISMLESSPHKDAMEMIVLHGYKEHTTDSIIRELLAMDKRISSLRLRICRTNDHLGRYLYLTTVFQPGDAVRLRIGENDYSGSRADNVFLWKSGGAYDLTIRMEGLI